MPRGASWAIVHDSHGLNIKSISHLYLEARSLTLSHIRFFSDGRVRHALDSKENREDKWRRKFSSAIYTKGLIEEVVTPITNAENSLTISDTLDDSRGSWSSLEIEGPLTPQSNSPVHPHCQLQLFLSLPTHLPPPASLFLPTSLLLQTLLLPPLFPPLLRPFPLRS